MNKIQLGGVVGLIFGVGLVALLIGVLTDVYSTNIGIIAAVAVWLVGGAIAVIILGKTFGK